MNAVLAALRPRPDYGRPALTWCGFWAGITAALAVVSSWWWLPVGAVLCGALAAVHAAWRR